MTSKTIDAYFRSQFKSVEAYYKWLDTPNQSLDGARPIELFKLGRWKELEEIIWAHRKMVGYHIDVKA